MLQYFDLNSKKKRAHHSTRLGEKLQSPDYSHSRGKWWGRFGLHLLKTCHLGDFIAFAFFSNDVNANFIRAARKLNCGTSVQRLSGFRSALPNI